MNCLALHAAQELHGNAHPLQIISTLKIDGDLGFPAV
jgi:hypothetical protein